MAMADLVGSATLVAVIVTDCAVTMTAGAVYNPFDKLPIEGFMDQVTEVFALPVTVGVNCLLCDAVRVEVEGLMPTLTLDCGGGSEIAPELPTAAMGSPAAVEATTADI